AYRRLSELRDAEDEIERLTAERNALIPVAAQAVPLGWKEIEQQNTRLREIAQEFCDRRDAGDLHSNYTYAKFKAALEVEK
ncbi:MAG: hypothetical protein GY938_03250, partial [Ketobacter sp.]|nr:hypothetical protein [Ketobacter sp.]